MTRIKHIFLPAIVLGMIISCNRRDAIQEESLFGKWNIVKAERNGRETPYLRGGYLVIHEGGNLDININGSEEQSVYTLEQGIIRTADAREFILQSVKTDSMVVQFVASPQSEFVFYMVRQHNANE